MIANISHKLNMARVELVISRYASGQLEKKEWFLNAVLHRENDLPAVTKYWDNGYDMSRVVQAWKPAQSK